MRYGHTKLGDVMPIAKIKMGQDPNRPPMRKMSGMIAQVRCRGAAIKGFDALIA